MQKLRHPKNLLQLANNTKDNRAGEKPYRLSKTGPSPGPSSRPPPIRAARPGFGAIVLLKQAPEPQGRGARCVMPGHRLCKPRPSSGAPSDAGPFDTAQLTRAFELDRDRVERDPTHRQKIRLAAKKQQFGT